MHLGTVRYYDIRIFFIRLLLNFYWINNPQMIYATIFRRSLNRDGVRTHFILPIQNSLNWIQSTAVTTQLQLPQKIIFHHIINTIPHLIRTTRFRSQSSLATVFWGSCNWVAGAVDWNQSNTGSNPVLIENLAKCGCIDHLWVINPLKNQ